MATNYRSGGVDFDNLFEPLQSGDPKRSATGYRVGGVDLADRYAAASLGAAHSAVGYKQNGVDIGPTFCKKGTAVRIITHTMTVGYTTIGSSKNRYWGYIEAYRTGSITPVTHKGHAISMLAYRYLKDRGNKYNFIRLVVWGYHEKHGLFNQLEISGTEGVFRPGDTEVFERGWELSSLSYWTAWQWHMPLSRYTDLREAKVGSKRTFVFK